MMRAFIKETRRGKAMATLHGRGAGAIAGLLLAAAAAQAAPPPEVFFGAPDIEEAVLSPSGKRLAITSAKGAKRVGLIVLDLAPGVSLSSSRASTAAARSTSPTRPRAVASPF
jgi:hypothetical protein